jgi:hypothetical protein
LTGATLTGAKLYAVSRFGLKTEGMTCEWVDLSPEGDKSEIFHLSSNGSKKFFNETLPIVRIIVDAPLDLDANLVLASIYHKIAQLYPTLHTAPSIEIGARKTGITFRIDTNAELFTVAYFAILPFNDAAATHQNIIGLVNTLSSQGLENLGIQERQRIKQLATALSQAIEQIEAINPLQITSNLRASTSFFQAPTHTVVSNSSNQSLNVYYHPAFGKHLMNQSSLSGRFRSTSVETLESMLPPVGSLLEFIQSFDYVGQLQ